MPLAADTTYLLEHIASVLAKQSDQVLQEQLGIGLSQFKILRTLQTEPRTTQREIAGTLSQTEASISRQVKLMLSDGLLQSLRNPKDRREHLTVVTPKGERLTEAASVALERYHHPAFAALSEKQYEQFAGGLERLHAQLCQGIHDGSASKAQET